MAGRATLYVISDDDAVRDSIDALFQANGIPVQAYESPAALLQDLPAMLNGCVLIDVYARGRHPIELLDQLRARGLSLPAIILVSGLPMGILRPSHAVVLQKPVAAIDLVTAVNNVLVQDTE